jgi:tRNA(Arg) A34 adenosine deaminase TadA
LKKLDELSSIKKELAAYIANEKEEGFLIAALKEALFAAQKGNFGVGAVLVKDDIIVARGHNKVFKPKFRSDLHAEMDVINKFENHFRTNEPLHGYTLYTTVECCPMCFCRVITSGVNRVVYLAQDEQGGMVHKLNDLPAAWIKLAARQQFEHANKYGNLVKLATRIFMLNVRELDANLGSS